MISFSRFFAFTFVTLFLLNAPARAEEASVDVSPETIEAAKVALRAVAAVGLDTKNPDIKDLYKNKVHVTLAGREFLIPKAYIPETFNSDKTIDELKDPEKLQFLIARPEYNSPLEFMMNDRKSSKRVAFAKKRLDETAATPETQGDTKNIPEHSLHPLVLVAGDDAKNVSKIQNLIKDAVVDKSWTQYDLVKYTGEKNAVYATPDTKTLIRDAIACPNAESENKAIVDQDDVLQQLNASCRMFFADKNLIYFISFPESELSNWQQYRAEAIAFVDRFEVTDKKE